MVYRLPAGLCASWLVIISVLVMLRLFVSTMVCLRVGVRHGLFLNTEGPPILNLGKNLRDPQRPTSSHAIRTLPAP